MPRIIASTYEIQQELGSGGGGVVYLGHHLRLDKAIVLKADKRKLSEKTSEAVLRETKALKDLNHTYIPQLYDFIVDGDTVYTVMDYVPGESLDKLLKRNEQPSQPQVIKWARQLLEAISYLHSPHPNHPYGILHGDIKPANIMLDANGDIRLIDFNIALALGEEGAVAVGRSIGYASPEHYGVSFSAGHTGHSVKTTARKEPEPPRNVDTNNATETAALPSDGTEAETSIKTETLLNTEIRLKTETSLHTEIGSKTEAKLDAEAIDINRASASAGEPPDKPKPLFQTAAASASGSGSSGNKMIILDARSDIYSLGATLYHLLTGKCPARNANEVKPISVSEFGIAPVINKAMHPDPHMRYQTASEMLYDFIHLHENDPRTKRHKRVWLMSGLMLAIMFAIGVFTAFVGLKHMELTQSAFALSEYSVNALADGNVPLAIDLALKALPERNSIFIPAHTSQALKALTDALGVYDLSDKHKPHMTLTLPSEPFSLALSKDGQTAAAVYAYNVAVFETETTQITGTLPAIASAYADAVFLNDATLLFTGEDGLCAYDTVSRNVLWTAGQATGVTVSADGGTIAAVSPDESFATIYDTNGKEMAVVSFAGKKHRVENNIFANPKDSLFQLNSDGSLLAVSFTDGSLVVLNPFDEEQKTEILQPSGFTRFEGGFFGVYFAFSAGSSDNAVFAVVDMAAVKQTTGAQADRRFGVSADEDGIYVALDNVLVKLDPVSGEQEEAAYTDSDVLEFARCDEYMLVATKDQQVSIYNSEARLLTQNGWRYPCDFLGIAGEFAVIGSRDTPVIRILKYEEHPEARIFTYESDYSHDEARLNADGTHVIMFAYDEFRLYDIGGQLINEVEIPDAAQVFDQQYDKQSGNLAVMYPDALRIYSGVDGSLVFEQIDLQSVFYAPYGISLLDRNGLLHLVDIGAAKVLDTYEVAGSFAAYCGMVVDDAFLDGRKLIGAGKTAEGYLFTLSDDVYGTVYDENGKKRFDIATPGHCEAFFTDTWMIVSPLHGTPTAYHLKTGRKERDLEKDAFMTYVTPIGDYIVSEYIVTSGERFATLLDGSSLETVAWLSHFTDIWDGKLLFDDRTGTVKESRVFTSEELRKMAVMLASDMDSATAPVTAPKE